MENIEKSIKELVETHFKDACDLEFTIQEGKLYILSVRPMRRTSLAHIKISIDLFLEKVIDESDLIKRISFKDILNYNKPVVENIESLLLLGKGLPAGIGSSSGKVAFATEEIIANKGQDYILCKEEVNPEDIDAMRFSKGIITSRGGLTSHAALVSRGFGLPCIVGIQALKIHASQGYAKINNRTIKRGDWITIRSNIGDLYLGRGIVKPFDWRHDNYLTLFVKILEKAICSNLVKHDQIGKTWLMRDYFLHNIPFAYPDTDKKGVHCKDYTLNKKTPEEFYDEISHKLEVLSSTESDNLNYIIQGLRNCLMRQFSQKVGIGKHFQYYRPLLDPLKFIRKVPSNDEYKYFQLIGEEFYDIGKKIPNLVDIYKVKIFFEIEAKNDSELWFLDFTNLRGESLVQFNSRIASYYIEINDKPIDHQFFPNLYNVLRKREYYWSWYNENNITHQQLLDYIRNFENHPDNDSLLNYYAHDLELLENNELTDTGKNLI